MKKPQPKLGIDRGPQRGARKAAKQAARKAAVRARRAQSAGVNPHQAAVIPQIVNFPLTRPVLPTRLAAKPGNAAGKPARSLLPSRHRAAAAMIALPLVAVSFMAALSALRTERHPTYRGLDVAVLTTARQLPPSPSPQVQAAPDETPESVAAIPPARAIEAQASPRPLVHPPAAPVTVAGSSRWAAPLAAGEPALTVRAFVPSPPLAAANVQPPQLAALTAGEEPALAATPQLLSVLATLPPAISMEPSAPAQAALFARDEPGSGPQVCMSEQQAPRPIQHNMPPAAFGEALASAALTQTGDLVIYNDTYRHMAYPMGDVAKLYGVCTDVVIRAYRTVGVDLQQLVHESGLGSGDTSIEHRRVETLRRFFARYGEQLPVTAFAEDYLPGDVVTYYRPQNSHSRSHIAVVSNEVGASGRYKIVHNRGWGPQAEDALFVDEITGHYRYWSAPAAPSDGLAHAAGLEIPAANVTPVRLVRAAARPRPDGVTVRGLGR